MNSTLVTWIHFGVYYTVQRFMLFLLIFIFDGTKTKQKFLADLKVIFSLVASLKTPVNAALHALFCWQPSAACLSVP